MFIKVCTKLGMKGCVAEYRFSDTRKFRLDFAFPDIRLGVEIDGGTWANAGAGGRHNRGAGFLMDMFKFNLLTELNWHLLRYTPHDIDYAQIKKVYEGLNNKLT
jgi:hypothetical protein